ncbi:MAG: FtsW/RodA/SpoVE family cell cycle protein, partial [Patescibacteria group bacterium]
MSRSRIRVDKAFLAVSVVLIVAGFFIFSSASLGLLAKESSNYSSVAFSQTVFGLFLGTVGMVIATKIDFKFWKTTAFYLFVLAIILNILVLFPNIGHAHGGARRWLMIGNISFQPSELLKLSFITYFAAWAASKKEKMATFTWGFLPLLVLLGLCGALLLKQPDTDTFSLIVITGLAMFVAGGGRWRYVFMVVLAGVIGVAFLAYTRPYVMQRITTFFNPSADSYGAGYQIQQSLIAIGSGGLFGRGFGQSVQKFTYLPEPVGDSIFAVAGEEFGFLGTIFLLCLYVFFSIRGLRIGVTAPDSFAKYLCIGII